MCYCLLSLACYCLLSFACYCLMSLACYCTWPRNMGHIVTYPRFMHECIGMVKQVLEIQKACFIPEMYVRIVGCEGDGDGGCSMPSCACMRITHAEITNANANGVVLRASCSIHDAIPSTDLNRWRRGSTIQGRSQK